MMFVFFFLVQNYEYFDVQTKAPTQTRYTHSHEYIFPYIYYLYGWMNVRKTSIQVQFLYYYTQQIKFCFIHHFGWLSISLYFVCGVYGFLLSLCMTTYNFNEIVFKSFPCYKPVMSNMRPANYFPVVIIYY